MKVLLSKILLLIASITSSVNAYIYKLLLRYEITPDYFDHDIDLFYQWKKVQSPHWIEKAAFNGLAIQKMKTIVPKGMVAVLDMCCADGFNTVYMYSDVADHVLGIDVNKHAIKKAQSRKSAFGNVKFACVDITECIPDSINGVAITNIIWDGSIQYFSDITRENILSRTSEVLEQSKGILSGSCSLNEKTDTMDIMLNNCGDVQGMLTKYYKYVKVVETSHPTRKTCYFWASNTQFDLV